MSGLAVDTYMRNSTFAGSKFCAIADPDDDDVDWGWARPRPVLRPVPRGQSLLGEHARARAAIRLALRELRGASHELERRAEGHRPRRKVTIRTDAIRAQERADKLAAEVLDKQAAKSFQWMSGRPRRERREDLLWRARACEDRVFSARVRLRESRHWRTPRCAAVIQGVASDRCRCRSCRWHELSEDERRPAGAAGKRTWLHAWAAQKNMMAAAAACEDRVFMRRFRLREPIGWNPRRAAP